MTVKVELNHQLSDFSLDLSFTINDGAITALFGPSGAGKSTVINAIAGLLRPDHGKISIGDRILTDTVGRTFVAPRARRIGYVFQEPRLFPHLNVEKNLLFGWRRTADRASKSEVDDLVELLGIESLIHRKPTVLSGGEKQRVALGRALLSNPELLLLDEPLAALDHKRRDEILPYLERIRNERNLPILYVSHSIDEVTRLADQLHVVDGGKIVASGDVAEVFSRLDLYPITGRFEAGAVVDGVIDEHDDVFQLSRIRFGDDQLTVPRVSGDLNDPVRVRIRARDIIVSRDAPNAISANNVLRGVISDMRIDDGPYADLQIVCGTARLVARITRHSSQRLALDHGVEVYAVIKSVTIDRRSLR